MKKILLIMMLGFCSVTVLAAPSTSIPTYMCAVGNKCGPYTLIPNQSIDIDNVYVQAGKVYACYFTYHIDGLSITKTVSSKPHIKVWDNTPDDLHLPGYISAVQYSGPDYGDGWFEIKNNNLKSRTIYVQCNTISSSELSEIQ